MIIAKLPRKITSTINGFELLLEFHKGISHFKNLTINISFIDVQWFEANLVAVLGAIIEYLEDNGNTVKLIEYERFKSINDVLFRNDFFSYFGIIAESLYDSSTQIPYRKFKENEEALYNDYIQQELLDNMDFPRHTKRLGREIKRSIFELFENARTHGKCSHIHTCGQFFPKWNKLNITIVDTGKTIINNVQEYLDKTLVAHKCISWAMTSGNTTKDGNTPGGLGLGLIFDFINLNKGKMQVISSNGYWELKEGTVINKDINQTFFGTIINLEFILEEGKMYSFLDEPVHFENIF